MTYREKQKQLLAELQKVRDALPLFNKIAAFAEENNIPREGVLEVTKLKEVFTGVKNGLYFSEQSDFVNTDDDQIGMADALRRRIDDCKTSIRMISTDIHKVNDVMKSLTSLMLWLQHQKITADLATDAGNLCLIFDMTNLGSTFINKALALQPNNSEALVKLGALSLKAGRYLHAQEILMRALKNSPHNEQIRRSLENVDRIINAHKTRDGKMLLPKELPPSGVETAKDEADPDATVSIVVPTLNAGREFGALLSTLRNQKGIRNREIIVVDSGSSDNTIDIANAYNAKIITIRPEDFTHSSARNLGAEHAGGNYILFITQDALPTSLSWLYSMWKGLVDHRAVAVSCKEILRRDADLYARMEQYLHYQFLGLDGEDRILAMPETETYEEIRKNAQLTNVACLIRKDIFMQYKFRNNYSEDLELGIRLIKDGHRLALLGSTGIIHSHTRPPYYHFKRSYVDNTMLATVFPDYFEKQASQEGLLNGIIHLHKLVPSIIHEFLSRRVLPVSVRAFTEGARKHFECGITSGANITESLRNIGYDDQLSAFLHKLEDVLQDDPDVSSRYEQAFLTDFLGSLNQLLDYMERTYDIIDEHIASDFASSVSKLLAQYLGSSLSAVSLSGNDEDVKKVNTLKLELTEGV